MTITTENRNPFQNCFLVSISDSSQVLTEDTDSFIIGDRVYVGGTKSGRIAFIGETKFAPGDWAGKSVEWKAVGCRIVNIS
jgi:Dynactin complex subunit involved in mitotic spindle partitioning in anaphase B